MQGFGTQSCAVIENDEFASHQVLVCDEPAVEDAAVLQGDDDIAFMA
jgi:hypothetical protein